MLASTPVKSRPRPALVTMLFAASLSGCAPMGSGGLSATGRVPLYRQAGVGELSSQDIGDKQARVVVLRPAAAAAAAASASATSAASAPARAVDVVNVYLNDRYLSSLREGAWTRRDVCAGKLQLAAVLDDAQARHQGRQKQTTELELQAGRTYFFALHDAPAHTVRLESIRAEQAAAVTAPSGEQVHPLPRVPVCE